AKTEKNVWLSTAQNGRRKRAITNFTQRVGIIHRSEEKCRRAVGTAYDATFPRRAPLRPWCNIVLRFFAAKVMRRIRRSGEMRRRKSGPVASGGMTDELDHKAPV